MANTLSGLYQTIYAAMNVVSRELIGFIPAVSKDAQAEQVTLNQPIRSPIVPTMAVTDITPSNVSSEGADRNVTYVDLTITKQKKTSFHLTAEEEKGLMVGGVHTSVAQQSFEQSFRALGNAIEDDLAEVALQASRAYGTAGTTPFNTADDLTDLSMVGEILNDNGAPVMGRSMILNTTALAKLQGKQPSVFRVNEDGSPMGRRMGAIGMLLGFDIGVSGQIEQHEKGGGTGYVTDLAAGYNVGDRAINVDTGTGVVKTGDVVTFAGDDNKYVVESGISGAGELTLARPGLREALADGVAMTIGNNYTGNCAFTRDAFHLACRVPAVPTGGDAADDRMIVLDPHSGLVYEIAIYRQYRQVSYEVGICWGVKAINHQHAALLIG